MKCMTLNFSFSIRHTYNCSSVQHTYSFRFAIGHTHCVLHSTNTHNWKHSVYIHAIRHTMFLKWEPLYCAIGYKLGGKHGDI